MLWNGPYEYTAYSVSEQAYLNCDFSLDPSPHQVYKSDASRGFVNVAMFNAYQREGEKFYFMPAENDLCRRGMRITVTIETPKTNLVGNQQRIGTGTNTPAAMAYSADGMHSYQVANDLIGKVITVSKIDLNSAAVLWSQQYAISLTGNATQYATGITLPDEGNLYITGVTTHYDLSIATNKSPQSFLLEVSPDTGLRVGDIVILTDPANPNLKTGTNLAVDISSSSTMLYVLCGYSVTPHASFYTGEQGFAEERCKTNDNDVCNFNEYIFFVTRSNIANVNYVRKIAPAKSGGGVGIGIAYDIVPSSITDPIALDDGRSYFFTTLSTRGVSRDGNMLGVKVGQDTTKQGVVQKILAADNRDWNAAADSQPQRGESAMRVYTQPAGGDYLTRALGATLIKSTSTLYYYGVTQGYLGELEYDGTVDEYGDEKGFIPPGANPDGGYYASYASRVTNLNADQLTFFRNDTVQFLSTGNATISAVARSKGAVLAVGTVDGRMNYAGCEAIGMKDFYSIALDPGSFKIRDTSGCTQWGTKYDDFNSNALDGGSPSNSAFSLINSDRLHFAGVTYGSLYALNTAGFGSRRSMMVRRRDGVEDEREEYGQGGVEGRRLSPGEREFVFGTADATNLNLPPQYSTPAPVIQTTGGLSTGGIIAISICVPIGVALIAFLGWFYGKKLTERKYTKMLADRGELDLADEGVVAGTGVAAGAAAAATPPPGQKASHAENQGAADNDGDMDLQSGNFEL